MSIVRDFLDMPNDSTQKTIIVATLLCLVCSVLVSGAAVMLKPIQEQNKALDKKKNILQIAGLMEEGKTVEELFDQVEARVVELESGNYAKDVDPNTFDARAAAVDPSQNVVLTKEQDIASIKRRAKYATVYLVRGAKDKVEKIILPVSGYGLWSTLHGFMSLSSDANTITGFGFYEHAETPASVVKWITQSGKRCGKVNRSLMSRVVLPSTLLKALSLIASMKSTDCRVPR